jgi:holo-[acyl-carrier protein] synthase
VIVGLGTDLVGVARIRALWQRHGRRFAERWFTPDEAAYALAHADPAERLAARWAAKEAAAKALGTGFADGVLPQDIALLPGPGGAPRLTLAGGALARATALGATRWHVSVSHADGFALAVVVIEAGSGQTADGS